MSAKYNEHLDIHFIHELTACLRTEWYILETPTTYIHKYLVHINKHFCLWQFYFSSFCSVFLIFQTLVLQARSFCGSPTYWQRVFSHYNSFRCSLGAHASYPLPPAAPLLPCFLWQPMLSVAIDPYSARLFFYSQVPKGFHQINRTSTYIARLFRGFQCMDAVIDNSSRHFSPLSQAKRVSKLL